MLLQLAGAEQRPYPLGALQAGWTIRLSGYKPDVRSVETESAYCSGEKAFQRRPPRFIRDFANHSSLLSRLPALSHELHTCRARRCTALEVSSDLRRLPDDTELAIFRIVQECLTNIHRHSGSATALIRIEHAQNRLVVRVLDRGKGIPADKPRELTTSGRTGVGFAGMRERVRALGGRLGIQSEGAGTERRF